VGEYGFSLIDRGPGTAGMKEAEPHKIDPAPITC
jgi:hypothetical protein